MNAAGALIRVLGLFTLIIAGSSYAVRHPEIANPRISSCGWGPFGGWCSAGVFFVSDGTQFVDIPAVGRPDPSKKLNMVARGLHCIYGNRDTGEEFMGCRWTGVDETEHSPKLLSKCELKSYDSWELTDDSTCVSKSKWGSHTGSGPGGECIVFAQDDGSRGSPSILSIRGVLDAHMTAISGSAFCQKILPPDVICDVNLPNVIDHGVVAPTASSSAVVEGLVDCGSNPKVYFVGGDSVNVGPGIVSRLSHTIVGNRNLRVVSNMTVTNGSPGLYQASVILVVSPY